MPDKSARRLHTEQQFLQQHKWKELKLCECGSENAQGCSTQPLWGRNCCSAIPMNSRCFWKCSVAAPVQHSCCSTAGNAGCSVLGFLWMHGLLDSCHVEQIITYYYIYAQTRAYLQVFTVICSGSWWTEQLSQNQNILYGNLLLKKKTPWKQMLYRTFMLKYLGQIKLAP